MTQDISGFIPPDDTDVTIGTSSENFGGADCLTWVAQVLSVPAKVVSPDGGGPLVVGGIAGLLEPDAGDAGPTSEVTTTSSSAVVWQAALAAVAVAAFIVTSVLGFAWSRRRIDR